MEKPNDRRRAYLRDVCLTDEEFERALEFVKTAEAADDFMSTSIGLAPFSPSFEEGEILGNWRIDKIIGSGGMGEVYLVQREADDFKHVAALKIARTKDDKYLARFEHERQILAKLEHANIGRLIDGGTTDDGQPFFVMEYVDGQSITNYAQAHKLARKTRLKLFSDLCRALSHSHSRLILHRDLKPVNILVSDEGQVKLIDFGVADNLDKLHSPGSVPTTLAYAAPEQITGETVTTATDIYALGGVLHELLTGVRLTNADNLSPELPNDLRCIIIKCRQYASEDRYDSVDALLADIRRFEKSEPIEARKGGWSYRTRKFIARYKFATISSALFIFSLSGGLVNSIMLNNRTSIALAETKKVNRELELEALIEEGFQYSFLAMYDQTDDGIGPDRIENQKIDAALLRFAKNAEKNVKDGVKIHAYYLLVAGQIFYMHGDHDRARTIFETLLSLEPNDQAIVILCKTRIVQILFDTGQLKEATIAGRKIFETYSGSHNFTLYERSFLAKNIALSTGMPEDQQLAIDLAKQSIAEFGRNPDRLTSIRKVAEAHDILARIYNGQKKYKLAADEFVTVFKFELQNRFIDSDGIKSGTNAAAFQIYFGLEGQPSLEYLPPLLDEVGKFGDDPGRKGYIYSLMAEAALLEGLFAQAIKYARQANVEFHDDKTAFWGTYYNNLSIEAKALAQMGKYDLANEFMQTAKSNFGASEPFGIYSQCRLDFTDAYIAALSGAQKRARTLFDAAVENCKKVRKPYDELSGSLQYHADRVEETLEKY
jgi:serine/threonine protein kinase